jgi:hypothetical protein
MEVDMKVRLSPMVLCLVLVVVLGAPLSVESADSFSSTSTLTQSDVALRVYQATHPYQASVSTGDALRDLQDRGVLPQSWDGQSTVTMAEVERAFIEMGIEVRASNSQGVVVDRALEQLLVRHQDELVEVGESWNARDQFSKTVTLGGGSRRIISGSDW